jgi:hypothetical protein
MSEAYMNHLQRAVRNLEAARQAMALAQSTVPVEAPGDECEVEHRERLQGVIQEFNLSTQQMAENLTRYFAIPKPPAPRPKPQSGFTCDKHGAQWPNRHGQCPKCFCEAKGKPSA